MSKIAKYYPEIVGSLICLTLGMASGYLSHASDSVWYAQLSKPFFNPPSWIFAPVWIILYLVIGIVGGMLWKNRVKNQKLTLLWIMQFIFNLLWSPIFFYCHSICLALIDVCFLWVSLLGLMLLALTQKPIIVLLIIPYFLWVSFAFVLNCSIYFMNISFF